MPATCYYEVLGVGPKATDEEIRKGYRKKALEWHPDKNADNLEEATEKFKEIQNAHAVLSDPNERAWYDGHKAQILRGDSESDDEYEDFVRGGAAGSRRGRYKGPDIEQYCNTSAYKGYSDEEGGFFATYNAVFAQIDQEEEMEELEGTYHKQVQMFGWSRMDHDSVAKFYRDWGDFVTKKEFLEADQYDVRQAPDRWVKRKMESENKKARTKVRKTYIDNVRKLVEFVKQKDPRWKAREDAIAAEKAERKRLAALKKEEEKRAAVLARERLRVEAAAEQAARDAELDALIAKGEISGGESSEEEHAGEEVHHCKACNKTFNSVGAKEQHFKSKKHEQRMWYLKKNGLLHLLESDEDDDDDDVSDSEDGELSASDVGEGTGSESDFDSADDAEQDDEPVAESVSAPTGRTLDGLDSIPTPAGAVAWEAESTAEEESSADLNFDSLWVRFSCGRITVAKKNVPKSYYWHSESEQLTLIPPDEGVMDVVEVTPRDFAGPFDEARSQDAKLHRRRSRQDTPTDASEDTHAKEDEDDEQDFTPPPGLSAKEKKKWLKRQERLRRNAGNPDTGEKQPDPEQHSQPEPEPEPEPHSEPSSEPNTQARIAALKRQLKKVEELRELQKDGMTLDSNQERILQSEPTLTEALVALEEGKQRCFDCAGEGKTGKGKRQKKCPACGGTGVIKIAQDAAREEPAPSPVRLTKKQLREKQKAEREAAAKAKAAKQDFNLHGRPKPYSKPPKSNPNPLKAAALFDDEDSDADADADADAEDGSGGGPQPTSTSCNGRDPDDMPPMGLTNKERKAWLKRQEKAARRADRSQGSGEQSDGVSATDFVSEAASPARVDAESEADGEDDEDGDSSEEDTAGAPSTPKTKRDKRRAKQKAKAEAEQPAGAGSFMCGVCSADFPSKTKLFKHLEETGHASEAAKQAAQSASKAAKKELRRLRAATSKKEGRGFGGAVRG